MHPVNFKNFQPGLSFGLIALLIDLPQLNFSFLLLVSLKTMNDQKRNRTWYLELHSEGTALLSRGAQRRPNAEAETHHGAVLTHP